MSRIISIVIVAILLISFKSDKPAYFIYNSKGKKVKFEKMINDLKDADIILFGELHNNPISHWLQYELTKEIYNHKQNNLILSAEMFESDNQLILDEYLKGLISEKKFETEARIWPNYKTDYKPLVNFAKDNNLQFVAANVPRRYASVVYGKGFEGLEELSDEAKTLIPPLPIKYNPELNCYKSMLAMGQGPMSHGNDNFPKAQAIKDATMSHFILKYWEQDKLLIHYNGAYHSDNYESVGWYLKDAIPELNIKTITTQSQEMIDTVASDVLAKADYIIVVPESMTKTH